MTARQDADKVELDQLERETYGWNPQGLAAQAVALAKRYQARAEAAERDIQVAITERAECQVIAAWVAAELSEGQARTLLGVPRIVARDMRSFAIANGLRQWGAYRMKNHAALVDAAQGETNDK